MYFLAPPYLMSNHQDFKKSLALQLLKVVFSIYLIITLIITFIQMGSEYQQESSNIKVTLQATEAIFKDSLTMAAWAFDSQQLTASLSGIQKIPSIVGLQILNMDKSPTWNQDFPIRLGITLNDNNKIINPNESTPFYLNLIPHHFQLKKNDLILGDVIIYSSNQVIFNKMKYNFLNIIIAALCKTLILWYLFIWAFNKYLNTQLNNFCQAMEKVELDNPKTLFLKLDKANIIEFHRIETVFNLMFKRVLESKNKLDNLNINLENKVLLRTQELSNKNLQLEELNQEKNEFLAIAAHDLKNPSTTIISFTQLIGSLSKNKTEQQKLKKYTEAIERNAKIIDKLLDIDKIESGNIQVNLTEINILETIKNVIMLYQQKAYAKKIFIHFQAINRCDLIFNDEFIVSQILDNLLSNAVKYSPINETVEIRLLKKENKIIIEIQNKGQILTTKDKENLFLKFSRLSPKPTANENSTGLGLYISQKLAAMIKTKIICKSIENQGTTFSLEFLIYSEK